MFTCQSSPPWQICRVCALPLLSPAGYSFAGTRRLNASVCTTLLEHYAAKPCAMSCLTLTRRFLVYTLRAACSLSLLAAFRVSGLRIPETNWFFPALRLRLSPCALRRCQRPMKPGRWERRKGAGYRYSRTTLLSRDTAAALNLWNDFCFRWSYYTAGAARCQHFSKKYCTNKFKIFCLFLPKHLRRDKDCYYLTYFRVVCA